MKSLLEVLDILLDLWSAVAHRVVEETLLVVVFEVRVYVLVIELGLSLRALYLQDLRSASREQCLDFDPESHQVLWTSFRAEDDCCASNQREDNIESAIPAAAYLNLAVLNSVPAGVTRYLPVAHCYYLRWG